MQSQYIKKLKIMKLKDIYNVLFGKYMYMNDRGLRPALLSPNYTRNSCVHKYNTRHNNDFHVPVPKKRGHDIRYKGPKLWLEIPIEMEKCWIFGTF